MDNSKNQSKTKLSSSRNDNFVTSKKITYRFSKRQSQHQTDENVSKVQSRLLDIKSNKDISKRNVSIPSTSQKKSNYINKSNYPERVGKNVASKRMQAMREQQKQNSLFTIKHLYKDQKKFISTLNKKLQTASNEKQSKEPTSTVTSSSCDSRNSIFDFEPTKSDNIKPITHNSQNDSLLSNKSLIQTSCDISSNEVESMDWEEIPEEEVISDIYSVRQTIIENPNQIQYSTISQLSRPNEILNSVVNIVIDTNILLSKLTLVDSLLENHLYGGTKPFLIIPWMVLQELDVIKTTPHSRIDKLARAALRYLNEKLRHSQLKGQSAIDASDQKIYCQVPDDHILNCCLQLKTNNNNTIILLSNDINLRNKALACEVNAYSSDEILNKLQEMFPNPDSIHLNQSFLCLQNILKEILTYLFQKEMDSAYGDIWKKMVNADEPATVPNLLNLIIKYWMPVFSFKYPKHTLSSLNQLLNEFSKYSSETESLNRIIDAAVAVCLNIQNVSAEYNSLMTMSIAQLKTILVK